MIEPSLQIGGGNWANKSDKLLGYHKDGANFYADELTFSRNSLASYTDANGLIQSMPYNLLTYSEDLSNAIWTKEAGNSITTNSTTAPNGTTTADTISATAGNELNTYQIITTKLGVYNYSSYVKKDATNLVLTYIYQTGVGFKAKGQINFDAETFTASLGTGTIESVGDGWFRVSLSVNLLAAEHSFGFYTESTTGTRSVYAWGAQANIGSTALPYFPTTTRLNLARVDYKDNINGSLILESQRTNLVTYSEDYTNAAWTKNGVTITANATTSPDGTQNADKIVESVVNDSHVVFRSATGTGSVFSFFAKAAERNWVGVLSNNGGVSFFNVGNGTLGTIQAGSTATITPYANGWYRCTLYNSHGSFGVSMYVSTSNGTEIYTGDGTSGVFLWGAQLEAESYATSYIKSEGAATTRLADSCSKTGISDKIGQTEGTLFVDTYVGDETDEVYGWLQASLNGSYDNSIQINRAGSSVQAQIYISTSLTAIITGGSIVKGQRVKLALGYANNDLVLYLNGTQIGVDTSTPIPACSALALGAYPPLPNDYTNNGGVNQVQLYKTRLTNAELATLTTL